MNHVAALAKPRRTALIPGWTFIMPRRNLWLLGTSILVCLACATRVNRYGRVFAFALEQVHRRSLNEVDERKLFEGALGGMIAQLGDRHSSYYTPADFAVLQQMLDQRFGGVGIEVVSDPDTHQLAVATPLRGGPAEKAGIRAGDTILQVDGKSIKGLSINEARDLLRGEVGTRVVLGVQHEGESKPVEIPIVRAVIQSETVRGDSRKPDRTWDFFLEGQDRVGYMAISDFGDQTADELAKAVRSVLDVGMQGLILDLRSNPGGLLESGVKVCDLFVSAGEIVTTRGRGGEARKEFRARDEGTLPNFPMAVLVNEYSASASEIVAACLQDHGRAVIVGEHTWGKDTVQDIIPLPPGYGGLKVTVASYSRPSGKSISRPLDAREAAKQASKAGSNGDWGVRPDKGYEVRLDKEQVTRLLRWGWEHRLGRPSRRAAALPGKTAETPEPALRTDMDPQLAKAVEYIRQRVNSPQQGPL
jgi:carboxyl-terminal processing protease